MKDRREHKRYKKVLAVRYSCAKGPLIVEAQAKSKDISAGGIKLPLDENLKISDRVRLAITVPWKHRTLDAVGKVVWVSPQLIASNLAIQRDCGLEFLWTSIPDVQKTITNH